jgi:8-oxo-dGTP pyrophosphatase MutT (NUDIX family)
VFPAGASEIEDSSDYWITSQNVAREFTRTAIRETYEETGVLVGSNTNFRKTESGAEFLNQCKEKGTKLYLDKLQYVMRVITPEIFKPRFYTTFFHII